MTDQYEVEVAVTYSGSYTDIVALGNSLSTQQNRKRIAAASKTIGLLSNFSQISIPYSDRLGYTSGSSIQSGLGVRTSHTFSVDEFFLDTFLPSPAAIGEINNVGRPLLTASLGSFQLGSSVPADNILGRPGISEDSLHVWFSGDGRPVPGASLTFPANTFVDTGWQISPFPFQTKYKTLPRTLAPGAAFTSYGKVTTDINGTPLANNILTNKVGSIYIAFADAGFNTWSRFSQIWSVTASIVSPTGDNKFNHAFNKNWNSLQDVFWNNFNGTGDDVYAAVGSNGVFLLSYDGINWEPLAKGEYPFDSDPDTVDDLITINTASQAITSPDFTRIHAEGYNDGSTSGNQRRWYAVVNRQVVRNSTFGPSTKIPTKTGWIAEDMDNDLGLTVVQIHDIGTTDPGGNETSTTITVAAVGEAEFNSGLIAFANKAGGAWIRNTSGVAAQASVRWYGFAVGDTTNAFMYACGVDRAPVTDQGMIARAPFSATSPHTQTWTDITPTPASLGLSDIPILRDVDYNETGTDLIAVGDDGFILRSLNGGTSWTVRTPPNGYTGDYVRIKARHGTNDWYALGADGAIHYSPDEGLTWFEADFDKPNATFGTFNSPTSIFAGSRAKVDSSATLRENPQIVVTGGSLTHPFNSSGNTTILVFRLLDAAFGTTDNVNIAALVNKGEFLSGSDLLTPSLLDYNKTFFGYGDGISVDLSDYAWGGQVNLGKGLLPSFGDFSLYDFYGRKDACTVRLYNPQIRGWKYGIYNGAPTATSVTFRVGKFGQLRDMLEQRKYSSFFDRSNGKNTVSYPIDIRFVTGSNTALSASIYSTATTQTTFNPEDSGTYDIHYRSGKPFNDTDSRA